MEFRNVRERPPNRPVDSDRPPADPPNSTATVRVGDAANSAGKGRSDGPEQGESRPSETGDDAARLARPGIGSRAADQADPGSSVQAPDSSAHRPPEALARPPMRPDRQKWLERLERAENRSGIRDELQARLNQLEPGHPSSPWHEDGTPRPPAPRLTDLERQDPRLSDTDYKAHVDKVVDGLENARAAGLSTEHLFTINADRDIWTAERSELHNEVIETVYSEAAAVPCERQAIVAGGLGGAGKTTLLERQAGIDLSKFITINPDNFKEELAKRGSIPEIDGLSPMECSVLVHEESSYLARQLARRALADGKNVIWDVTMSSANSTVERIEELRASGYQRVDGIFVDIPVETSVTRTTDRHRRGHDRFLAGDSLGGRYVPAEVIRAQADEEYGSLNRRAFESVKNDFDSWIVYDNSIRDRPTVVVDQKNRDVRDQR
jgi:predicted ABC-type ATPase